MKQALIDWHWHLIEHLRFDLRATLDYADLSLPKSPRWCIYRPAGHDISWRTAENLHLDVPDVSVKALNPVIDAHQGCHHQRSDSEKKNVAI